MAKTKDISPAQYAKLNLKGKSIANITKHIRKGNWNKLPHVISLKNFGRFYLLEVPENITSLVPFKKNKIINKYKTKKDKVIA